MFTSAFWWAITGVVLMILELIVPGLVLVFFGIGACITGLAAWLLPISLEWQVAIFIVASLASLISLRHYIKSVFLGSTTGEPDPADEVSSLIGTVGEVTSEIEPGKFGRIMLNGAHWKAEADAPIPQGTLVEVIGQENLTLKVKPKS